jgi:hypothetical protein
MPNLTGLLQFVGLEKRIANSRSSLALPSPNQHDLVPLILWPLSGSVEKAALFKTLCHSTMSTRESERSAFWV